MKAVASKPAVNHACHVRSASFRARSTASTSTYIRCSFRLRRAAIDAKMALAYFPLQPPTFLPPSLPSYYVEEDKSVSEMGNKLYSRHRPASPASFLQGRRVSDRTLGIGMYITKTCNICKNIGIYSKYSLHASSKGKLRFNFATTLLH